MDICETIGREEECKGRTNLIRLFDEWKFEIHFLFL